MQALAAGASRARDVRPTATSVLCPLFADRELPQGHDDKSREWVLRSTAEFPEDGGPYLTLAAIDALQGRSEQAKSDMARRRPLPPRSSLGYVEILYRTSNPAVIAQRTRPLDGMRRAGLPEGY
jgi:hypothetical protein